MTDEKARKCKAFDSLDLTCLASDPCELHGCDDTDDDCTSAGCYCDSERRSTPGERRDQ